MNLTITVDDDTLLRARQRALQERTSVNAVLKRHLEEYAGTLDRQRVALERFVELSRTSSSRSGGGERWTRDELYER